MSPELEQAIRERIELGHTKEQIIAELKDAGYDEATTQAVYVAVAGTEQAESTIPTNTNLIGYRALVSQSFGMIASEWRLLWVSSLYGLVFMVGVGVLAYAAYALSSSAMALAIFVGFAAVVVCIIGILALSFGFQRALLYRKENIDYLDHVRHVLPHVGGIFLVSLYVQFATSFGYLLLVLPGIALSIYLSYAVLVRIAGLERGTMSLVRSTQLVYGRWWSVFGRVLFSVCAFVLCLVPVLLVLVAVSGVSEQTFMNIATDMQYATIAPVALFVLIIFGALIFVAFLMQCAMVLLFESLQATAVPFTPAREKKLYFWMKVAIVLGIPASILLNGSDMFMAETNMEADTSYADPTMFEEQVANEQAEAQAELEAFMEEFEAEFEAF